MRHVPSVLKFSLVAALGLAACVATASAADASAVATLTPAAPGVGAGKVTFTARDGGVDVHVEASGLAPGSSHGFHVHDNGVCTGPDFMSAGGHFNPGKMPHGPQDGPHHMGDMPGLVADDGGKVDAHFALAGASLDGAQGLVGHAVVLHAGADDYKTQPTGNSGGRIACGVIAAN